MNSSHTTKTHERSTWSPEGLKAFLVDSIHQRYPYLDRTQISLDDHRINPTDYLYPNLNLNSSEYSDPIIWFRYQDKKYIMREQLEYYIMYFPIHLAYASIPEDIDFNPGKFLRRLYDFYRNEETGINSPKLKKFFPKFIDETYDFIIFEYIPEEQLRQVPEDLEISKFKFIKANNQILKVTKDFRPRNNLINWSIRDNEIFYTNITKFVLLKSPTKNITIADKKDTLI